MRAFSLLLRLWLRRGGISFFAFPPDFLIIATARCTLLRFGTSRCFAFLSMTIKNLVILSIFCEGSSRSDLQLEDASVPSA